MNERLLKAAEVTQKTSLSMTEITRREKAGDFPRRITLGRRSTVWVGSEIESWVQKKIAARGICNAIV